MITINISKYKMQEYKWLYGTPPPIEERKYDANEKIIIEDAVKVFPNKCEKLFNGEYLAYMLFSTDDPYGDSWWDIKCYYYFILYIDKLFYDRLRILRYNFCFDICRKILGDPQMKINYCYIRVKKDKNLSIIDIPEPINKYRYIRVCNNFCSMGNIILPSIPLSMCDIINCIESKNHIKT